MKSDKSNGETSFGNGSFDPLVWDPAYPLRIIPLGGLGEIGMNNLIFEDEDSAFLVDCGVMFPNAEMLGVDLVIPDWRYLEMLGDKFKALIITHGHEDHIGAIPYFLRRFPDIPIYAPRFASLLIRSRLEEHKLGREPTLHQIVEGEEVSVGAFKIRYLRVNHSIPDSFALAIDTPVGKTIHTADFKIDSAPPDNERMDFAAFSRYGEEGVHVLLSDSTNVDRPGFSISEREVGATIREIFEQATGRVILATFSTNIYRIQQVISAGHQAGRKLLIEGRSMIRNAELSNQHGYLDIPEGMEIRSNELENWSDDRLLILTTGSQGEPMSALVRMSGGEHRHVEINEDDTIILSSKFIPGNERAIHQMLNRLAKRGAEIIFEKVSEVHVSGHASREELKMMINLTRPKFFVPVHGEYRHLKEHARLAESLGIGEERSAIIENGVVLGISSDGFAPLGEIPLEKVFVDGKGVGDIGQPVIRDRKHLSEGGIVIAMMNMDHRTGSLLAGPLLFQRGVAIEEESDRVLGEARDWLATAIEDMPMEIKTNEEEFRMSVRRVVNRYFKKTLDRRPLIVPIVSEM